MTFTQAISFFSIIYAVARALMLYWLAYRFMDQFRQCRELSFNLSQRYLNGRHLLVDVFKQVVFGLVDGIQHVSKVHPFVNGARHGRNRLITYIFLAEGLSLPPNSQW